MARILLFLWSIHTKFRQNRRKPHLQANKMVKKWRIFLSMEKRQNRIPVHRCHHDPTSRIGLDSSSRPSRSRLLPHKRRPLCLLVERQVSFLKITLGCWLEPQCCKLDVAFLLQLLLPIFQSILPCLLRQEDRPQWRLYQIVHSQIGKISS